MPPRIFSSVDLPVPFAPTSPTLSFGVMSQFRFSKSSLGPKRFPAEESWIMRLHRLCGRLQAQAKRNLIGFFLVANDALVDGLAPDKAFGSVVPVGNSLLAQFPAQEDDFFAYNTGKIE